MIDTASPSFQGQDSLQVRSPVRNSVPQLPRTSQLGKGNQIEDRFKCQKASSSSLTSCRSPTCFRRTRKRSTSRSASNHFGNSPFSQWQTPRVLHNSRIERHAFFGETTAHRRCKPVTSNAHQQKRNSNRILEFGKTRGVRGGQTFKRTLPQPRQLSAPRFLTNGAVNLLPLQDTPTRVSNSTPPTCSPSRRGAPLVSPDP